MNLRQRFEHYLAAYARKDLEAIAALLADEVSLRDWNLAAQGCEAVLAETRKNFDAAASLEIEILRCFEGSQTVAGELRIVVDRQFELLVVDVLEFDAGGWIRAIRAYKG